MIIQALSWFKWLMRPRSTRGAIRRFLGWRLYRQFKIQCVDDRECIEVAASLANVPIDAMVIQLAEQMHLPWTFDLRAEMRTAKQTTPKIDAYISAAAVPIFSGRELVAVAGVDPARIAQLFPECKGKQFVLCARTHLQTCATGSLQTVVSSKEASTSHRALSAIVREMQKHGSPCFELHEGSPTHYRFTTAEGRLAKGSLSPSTIQEVLRVVAESSPIQLEGSWFEIAREGHIISFRPKQVHATNTKLSIDQKSEEKSRRVLLVDDSETFCSVVQRFLERHGFTCVSASNGKQALETLSGSGEFAVAICDLHMPEMNGFEFLRTLHRVLGQSSIKLVMLSSDPDPEAEITALGYGVDAFISKRLDPRVLLMHLRRLTGQIEREAS